MSPIMKVCTLALIGIVLLSVGCGSSNSNPNKLTQAQAQQLGTETFTQALAAMEDFAQQQDVAGQVPDPLNSSRKSNPLAVLSKVKSMASVTFNCPDGGTIAVDGTSSNSSFSVTMTPASCSDGTLVLNGNPDITVSGNANDNGTTTTVSVAIGGDVSFAPVTTGAFPTGSCGSNLSISAAITDSTETLASCSITGTMCGQTINYTCPE